MKCKRVTRRRSDRRAVGDGTADSDETPNQSAYRKKRLGHYIELFLATNEMNQYAYTR